jgi:hypothetical protein
VTTAPAVAGMGRAGSERTLLRLQVGLLIPLATAFVILALALLMLLSPIYIHPALEASAAPATLGVPTNTAFALSDRTVAELLLGPGSFDFAGPDGRPFYDPAERGHMQDARVVLWLFLGVCALSAVLLAGSLLRTGGEARVWRAVARGGGSLAIGLVVAGAVATVAFELAFELFHRLLFPAGNWQFDPSTQRLVQLYPLAFWQLSAAAMGVLGVAGGVTAWLVGRRRARALEGRAG